VTELLLVNSLAATRLLRAGVQMLPTRVVNGTKVFVFSYTPGQTAIVRRVLNNAPG